MKHHRRSIRLKGYDYSQAGAYFITICCLNRECLFGEVVEGTMHPNEAGKIVRAVWEELPSRFPPVSPDAFVVMPNHIHGIIVVGALLAAPPLSPPSEELGRASPYNNVPIVRTPDPNVSRETADVGGCGAGVQIHLSRSGEPSSVTIGATFVAA